MREYNLFPRQAEVEPQLRAGSTCLNWEMRLGKTRACLNAFDKLWQTGGPKIAIVICPSIAKGVWAEENHEMGLDLPVVMLDGITKRRAAGERIAGLPLLLILNWEIVDAHLAELLELVNRERVVLILDETHDHCCNPRNDRYRAVKDLSVLVSQTWILTGTLYRKSAMDLHWQLRLLGPSAYPYYYMKTADFGNRFCYVKYNRFSKRDEYKGILPGAEKEFAKILSIDARRVEGEPIPDELCWWLDEGDAWQYDGGDDETAMSTARSELSELKARRTVEFVRANHLTNEPLVIFGWHKRFVRHVAAELAGAVIDGDTSSADKTRIRQEFAAGRISLVVANIQSAGVAIDLASARNAVFGEVDWIKATMRQAEARLKGPKQTRKVSYFYILCRRSVDEHVWRSMLGRGRDMKRIDAALSA